MNDGERGGCTINFFELLKSREKRATEEGPGRVPVQWIGWRPDENGRAPKRGQLLDFAIGLRLL
jgi:hypothetical protein